jgi:hypothetical protein
LQSTVRYRVSAEVPDSGTRVYVCFLIRCKLMAELNLETGCGRVCSQLIARGCLFVLLLLNAVCGW